MVITRAFCHMWIENLLKGLLVVVDFSPLHDSKDFIEYSNDTYDIYKNREDYNPNKKQNIVIVFDDMPSNKKLNPIVTELFIRGRKLNTSLVFITQSYFAVPKNARLNSKHYLMCI